MPIQEYSLRKFLPNPYMHYRRWVNARTMDRYLGKVLDARFAEWKKRQSQSAGPKKKSRSVMDLAIETWAKEQPRGRNTGSMSGEFKKGAISQMKTFLFAGHDTTSSTICYAYHLLSKHPACLQKLREEHDRVLGSVAQAPQRIKDDPYILNQLDYTLAVTKEVLRLWPPASGLREGAKESVAPAPPPTSLSPFFPANMRC